MPMRGLPRLLRACARAGGASPALDCHAPICPAHNAPYWRAARGSAPPGRRGRTADARRPRGRRRAGGWWRTICTARRAARRRHAGARRGRCRRRTPRAAATSRAPSAPRRSPAGVDRRLEFGERGLPVAQAHVRVPGFEARLGEARIELARAAQAGERLLVAPLAHQHQADAVVRLGEIRPSAPPRDRRRAPPARRRGRARRWRGCGTRRRMRRELDRAASSAIAW